MNTSIAGGLLLSNGRRRGAAVGAVGPLELLPQGLDLVLHGRQLCLLGVVIDDLSSTTGVRWQPSRHGWP